MQPHRRLFTVLLSTVALAACQGPAPDPAFEPGPGAFYFDTVEMRQYVCRRPTGPLVIDGRLDEESWRLAHATQAFIDIRGEGWPEPRQATRARMLWDDRCFYIGAVLEETAVWATLTKRDSIIYYDNDFEVFIDPDGDTHQYYELEVNAFGTDWDLLLVRPYRDGGPAIHAWDIPGLESAVYVDGTINDPSDVDRGWSVEIAIPWAALAEASQCAVPPAPGDTWRVNYSRVQWRTHAVDGKHVKLLDPESGEPLPEDNWVWSPQGVVDMHRPECWGFVRFANEPVSDAPAPRFKAPDAEARLVLRRLHERQRAYREVQGYYAGNVAALGLEGPPPADWMWPPFIRTTPNDYEAVLLGTEDRLLHITGEGRIFESAWGDYRHD